MFDIGWSELLVIGVVALIVVGPRDLPRMFRTFGQAMGKARGMAREFTRAMEAAADETGVKEVARSFRDTTSGKSLRQAAGFDEIEKEFRAIGHDLSLKTPAGSPGTPGSAAGAGAKPGPAPENGDPASKPASDPGETELERLRRAAKAAEARLKAAEARAARAAPQAAPAPPAPPGADS